MMTSIGASTPVPNQVIPLPFHLHRHKRLSVRCKSSSTLLGTFRLSAKHLIYALRSISHAISITTDSLEDIEFRFILIPLEIDSLGSRVCGAMVEIVKSKDSGSIK